MKETAGGTKPFFGLWLTAFVLLLADQIVKFYIEAHYQLGYSFPIIEDIFHFTYILNPGAAFSILAYQRFFFIGVNVLLFILGAKYYQRLKKEDILMRYGCALLFGGAVGNLIDRVRLGAVIDFIDFRIWPIFNFADIGITIGVTLMMYSILKRDEPSADSSDA